MTVPETWPRDLCCGGNTSTATTAIRNTCSLKTNDEITIRQNDRVGLNLMEAQARMHSGVAYQCHYQTATTTARTDDVLSPHTYSYNPLLQPSQGRLRQHRGGWLNRQNEEKKNSKQEALRKTGAAAAHRRTHTHVHTQDSTEHDQIQINSIVYVLLHHTQHIQRDSTTSILLSIFFLQGL